jgi:ketosteroid isomerase-like protein
VRADEQALRQSICAPEWDIPSEELARFLGAYFVEDSVIYLPNSPPLTTGQLLAITSGWAADPAYVFRGTTTALQVAQGGDLAYCAGTYTTGISDPEPRTETGYWVTTFRKTGGVWKVATDIHVAERLSVK